jgi:hypothetical protein
LAAKQPKRVKDVTGERFGHLVVIERSKREENQNGYHARWLCRCDCGNFTIVRGTSLRRGLARSCGCKFRTVAVTTHGKSKTREWRIWASMKARCNNPNNEAFENYGGRGISVCKRWEESFEAFWEDMGPRPSDSHSIDRINNDGNYEPGNCCWTTNTVQCRNRRSNRLLTFNGKTQSVAEWADELGIKSQVIANRLRRGWSVEATLATPVDIRKVIPELLEQVPQPITDLRSYG